MAGHKDIWGPHIDHYSQDLNFNLDAAEPSGDMSVSKLSGPWKDMEVMPMSLLETTLTRFNLRRGSCYGYRPLAVLLLTLQNYQRVNTSRVSAKNYLSYTAETLGDLDIQVLLRISMYPVHYSHSMHRRTSRNGDTVHLPRISRP